MKVKIKLLDEHSVKPAYAKESDAGLDLVATKIISNTSFQITYGLGITPPVGDDVSTILQVRFTRDKTNASGAFTGSDTHTATADITSLDIHIEVNMLGSHEQYTK